MKKLFVALTLTLFVGTISATSYAATNGDGDKTEIKKGDKKKKKKSCDAKSETKSCNTTAEKKACCAKK